MRRTFLSIAALAALTTIAGAEPRAARPQPTPSALSPQPEASAPDDPIRAAAKAHQDAFDKRLAQKSERAMRSICMGCDGGPAGSRPAARKRVDAKAGPSDDPGDDFIVDDPAEAPAN